MYKIEKNIPLIKWVKWSKYVWILNWMDIWDSFVMDTLSEAIKFQSARNNMKPKRFSVRQWENKYRCWRVE